MKVTRCVPLVGQGVIVRYGALVGVTARTPDPDPLLSALAEAASSAGDGGDLVVRAARAALRGRGQQAWACAGVTADGGVAVQVHGRAVAAVRVDGGPEVTLTADGSVTPVSRKFNGATVALGLVVGATAPPDPRFWLGDGVVCGGGLAVTVTADVPEMATPMPDGPVGWHPPTADAPALETPGGQHPSGRYPGGRDRGRARPARRPGGRGALRQRPLQRPGRAGLPAVRDRTRPAAEKLHAAPASAAWRAGARRRDQLPPRR